MTHLTKETSDRETIRKWTRERGGKPAVIKERNVRTEILRIDFPDQQSKNLEDISWEEWFDIFEKNDLQFIYQDETISGEKSQFNKLVSRHTVAY